MVVSCWFADPRALMEGSKKLSNIFLFSFPFILHVIRKLQVNDLQWRKFLLTINIITDTSGKPSLTCIQGLPVEITENRKRTKDTVTQKHPVRTYRGILPHNRKRPWTLDQYTRMIDSTEPYDRTLQDFNMKIE